MNKKQLTLDLLAGFENKIPDDKFSRVIAAASLFDYMDSMRDQHYPSDWHEQFESLLTNVLNLLSDFSDILARDLQDAYSEETDAYPNNTAAATGEVYYKLWRDFDEKEYYDKTVDMLSMRLNLNNVDVTKYSNVLDDGCGSGRYSQALKKLGAKKITGIDVSQNSVDFATSKNRYEGSVSYKCGSVLELPFLDNEFDFVFSNGVLHHTTDTYQGLKEVYRVLRQGGECWLYLYGGKDSFFWDIVDSCRRVLKDVPESFTINAMKFLVIVQAGFFIEMTFFTFQFIIVTMRVR